MEREPINVSAPDADALMQEKRSVMRVSQSARSKREHGPSPFAFIPSSAPVVVRRWPKI